MPYVQSAPTSYEVNPITEALNYLEELDLLNLVDLAKIGVHVTNPYHNLTHELLVVYHAMTAYYHRCGGKLSASASIEELRILAIAALFHDHDHSGGKTTDDLNIERAIARVSTLPILSSIGLAKSVDHITDVCSLIRKTEFTNGGFPFEPMNFSAKCLRDADLCMIYTTQGRQLLMELPREHAGVCVYRVDTQQRRQFLIKNKEFLQSCPMYTEYGQLMKEFHLERSCEDLEDLVECTAKHVWFNT